MTTRPIVFPRPRLAGCSPMPSTVISGIEFFLPGSWPALAPERGDLPTAPTPPHTTSHATRRGVGAPPREDAL